MLLKAHKTYDAYAEIYDTFKADRSSTVALLEDLIKKHNPQARKVLDLACGTGSIAVGLANAYQVTGLDQAAGMLKVAKKKLPRIPLVQSDMVDFKIDDTFDVVYCLHNSVNHLLAFDDWQKMFKNVAAHLNPGGIFIFDVNPAEKLDALAKLGLSIMPIKEDYIMTQVTKDTRQPEKYHWDVKIFKKQRNNNYSLHHEAIKVSSYPLERVKEALSKDFTVTDFFVLEKAARFEDIGRAYFVGLKK